LIKTTDAPAPYVRGVISTLRAVRLVLYLLAAYAATIFVSRGVWTAATGHKVGYALLGLVMACIYGADRISGWIKQRA
jgi:hypothetical protein